MIFIYFTKAELRFLVQMCRRLRQQLSSKFRSLACAADVSDAPLNQLFSNTHVEETCDHEIILWTWSHILVGGLWPQDIPQVQLTEGFHLLVHLQGKNSQKWEEKFLNILKSHYGETYKKCFVKKKLNLYKLVNH